MDSSSLKNVLDEWDGGCFLDCSQLSEAYTLFLLALLDATPEERQDPSVLPFLRVGYGAYLRDQGSADPNAALTYEHFPATRESGENRFEQTKRLTALFKRAGYTVIEKWECEFRDDLKSDPAVKQYFETHPTTRATPLNLRDGLYGGRTSALRWYHKADIANGEKIKMVDVVSKYPSTNLRGEYPYGNPTLYLEGDPHMPTLEKWNGMIKCTVLPPRDLFIPVPSYKCNAKLMFPLCRICMGTESSELCQHNPADRQLTGNWCAPELKLAVQEKGYKLISVHEVYQYPGTKQYNPETGEDGIMSGYIRRFMALKIEASGWPVECETEEQKQKYVADVLRYDGITINPDKIEKNAALRTLGKLMANSYWGKYGEKTLRPSTELIYKYEDLMTLITDPTKKITGLVPLGDHCLQVSWKYIAETEVSLPTSSVILAAFTTCFGRLQLYKYLDVVQKRALYHDTDSVAYISRPGEPDLPLGTHLGDLTDQIEEDYGPGSYITEFVAGGPKNYAYKVAVGGDLDKIKVTIKLRYPSLARSHGYPHGR
ncbi:hypothetical protein ONE63_000090 [Megalurothrips usitatus]|uniref:DNA-directed DNA polymerase n=1 Tax=Megalurothrips usitatus TaxID=439358 RepID=A0AAV7XZV9_9NEOP|nr:hypothetical protein ONE63_000090 [Megalurothrips usitatus]